MKIMFIIFSKKKIVWGKGTVLDSKMVCPHDSGAAGRIFLKILHTEKCQQVDDSNNNGLYQNKCVQGKWVISDPKMIHPRNSKLALKMFFKFCTMKGAHRYMKILLVAFQEKNHLGQFDLFRSFFTVWLGMVEIEPGYSQYHILKQSGHNLF